MKRSILAIGAHADDLEMSMGGTLLKYHQKYGYEIHYVLCTDNAAGNSARLSADGGIISVSPPAAEEQKIRQAEAEEAAEKFFRTKAVHLNYPQRHYTDSDGRKTELRYGAPPAFPGGEQLPSILTAYEDENARKTVAEIICSTDPEVIITMGLADPNPEHICTGLLVRRAYDIARNRHGYDGTLIHALTPAPMGLGAFYDCADTFVDTSGFHQSKLAAIAVHRSQKPAPERLDLRDFDEGARFGCETAEKFVIGSLAVVRTGALAVELRQNHRICLQQLFGDLM